MKNNEQWLADMLKGMTQPQEEQLPSPLMRQPVAFTEPEQITAQMPANVKPELPMMYKNSREMLPLPAELQQELSPATPAPQVAQAAPTKPSIEELLNSINAKDGSDDLRKAQGARDSDLNQLLMLKGINRMALSQASQNIDPDFLKEHMDMARTKVPDAKDLINEGRSAQDQTSKLRKSAIDERKASLEIGDKEAENNPKSPLSESFRKFKNDYYKSMGSKLSVPEGLSYADMAKSTNVIDQSVMAAYLAKQRSQDNALKREEMSATKATKANENSAKFANTMNEQLKDAIKIKDNGSKLRKTLISAQKDPSGLKDIASIYQFIKVLDSDSAVKEGEVVLIRSAIPVFENLKNTVEGQLKGDVSQLSPQARQQMLDIAGAYADAADSAYQRKLSTKKAIADDMNIPQKYYDPYFDEKPASPASKFPMTLYKGSKIVDVSNESELKEAQDKGWK